jgi:hypothetical protein
MKRRLNFSCCNVECQREYSLLLKIEGYPKLKVECPYCGKEGIADLDAYRDRVVEVFRTMNPDK